MNLKRVLEVELEKISLSKDELKVMEKIAKNFIVLLEKNGLKAFIGGSLAKGTMIRKSEDQDIDIFVVFDSSEKIKSLEKILKKITLTEKLKLIHGSRDYFQIEEHGIVLEIVPVIKDDGKREVENVTDFSLSHVKYLRKEIKKSPKLADEIRLAKAFCKAQRFYGAESYIKGFSGYSLEVFVIYFGGFTKFLKKISKLKADVQEIYDPVKHYHGKNEILREINSSKLQGPIVLVDPMKKSRNISAGLSEKTFSKFLKVVRSFLKNPDGKYFDNVEIDVEGLKEFAKNKDLKFVEIDLKTDRQEGDIAGTKCRKFFDFFVCELERKQQRVIKEEFDYSGKGKTAKGYLVIEEKKEIEIRGPLKKSKKEILKAYKKANLKIFRKGKYYFRLEKSGVGKVYESLKKVEREMGVSGRIV